MTSVAARAKGPDVSKRPKEWATWQGRVVWMVEDYIDPPTISQRELERRAGLPDGSLWNRMSRLKTVGTAEKDPDLAVSTLISINKVIGASWEWIIEGKGWPSESARQKFGGSHPPLRAVRPTRDDED